MARRIPTVLTNEELAAIYRQLNERTVTGKRDRALLQVMADAGLRISEALELQIGDLEREGGRIVALTVQHGKGDKGRRVFVTEQLADKLEVWLEARSALGCNGRGPVFVTIKGSAGEPLTPRTVQKLVRRLAEAAGIERHVTPHTLRHTAATRRLRAGVNLRCVQADLGHARLETTAVYTHVVDEERRAATESLAPVDGPAAPRQEQDPQAQALARAIATLTPEQRRALALALLAGAEQKPRCRLL